MDSELQPHQKPGGAHKRGAAVVKQVAGSIQRAAVLDEIRKLQIKEHTDAQQTVSSACNGSADRHHSRLCGGKRVKTSSCIAMR